MGIVVEDLLKKFEDEKEATPSDQPKIIILIIDDDESIREGISSVLSHKYRVLSAENGRKGVEILSEDIHCVILDVKMKELNGFLTYPRLKAKSPNVPIIFYTAFQSEHDLQKVINQYRPEGYVEKGRDISFLENLIEKAVRKFQLILENEEYKHALERKVEERTAELCHTLDELKATQAQLVQSEKMASLGTLAAGIAHEINNPAVGFKRGTDQLVSAIRAYETRQEKMGTVSLDEEKRSALRQMSHQAYDRGLNGPALNTKELRQRARELEIPLKAAGLTDYKTASRSLAPTGFALEEIAALLTEVSGKDVHSLIEYLKSHYDMASIIRMMEISAERIITITDSLRRYSHLDRQPQGEVDIREGVEDTLTILNNELKYGVTIFREYGEIPPITCYPAELAQVWTNLIYNAVQAMDGKGDLTIRIFETGEQVGVNIMDSGPGIPEGLQQKIFDPFFSTKDQGRGTGLGLSICHGIVQKHGGSINVTSKPGETMFRVLLPKYLPANRVSETGEGKAS